MPFVLKKFNSIKNMKVDIFLIKYLDFSQKEAQRLIDRKRVLDKKQNFYTKSDIIRDEEIFIALFEGITKGLKPIIETTNLAIFDKPSSLVVHPTSRYTKYSLLDEIRYYYGKKANLVHRIDFETSGLVLVAKDKESEILLKKMFEEKKYKKKYLALVKGIIKDKIIIDKPIGRSLEFDIKMKINGKKAKDAYTIVKPLKYINNNTLLEIEILTGRTHQIRVHLDYIGHSILGDYLYGVNQDISRLYLDKKLSIEQRIFYTGAKRLMLQANYLEFYFNNLYKIYSKQNLLKDIV